MNGVQLNDPKDGNSDLFYCRFITKCEAPEEAPNDVK